MTKQHDIEGLDEGVGWAGYDPAAWRDHPEPPGQDKDDDEDIPTPADVKAITGIDPDAEGWDD